MSGKHMTCVGGFCGRRARLGPSRPSVVRVLASVLSVVVVAAVAAPASAAPAPAPWVARHNLSPAQYQAAYNEFTSAGLRLTSVSGYVTAGKLRYAALWRKLAGPPWIARHGMSSGAYQKAFDDNAKAGFRLVYVSGYEVGGTDRYAAIWEKLDGPAYVARHRLSAARYQTLFDRLTKTGYRLVHVSAYTKRRAPRYAAIFEKTGGPAGRTHPALSFSQYQQKYTQYAKQGFRLKLVSGYHAGGKDRYAAIWEKVGGPVMRARHGVAVSKYQRYFDIDRFQGYAPTYVQGFTSGASAKLNTVWESPFRQQDLKALSSAAEGFLQARNVAGLSVAIAKGGRLLYASGFGLADRENEVKLDVSHLLRIGSISKTVTAVAMYKLIEDGRLATLERKVFGPGGVLADVNVPDTMKPLEAATIKQFLEHTSGLPGAGPTNRDPDGMGPLPWAWLPLGDPVNCGTKGENNLSRRIEIELARHAQASAAAGKPPLLGNPGEWNDYSNFSHIIAERVIENLSGRTYADYVRARVFAPSGLTAPNLFKIGPFDASSREAKHYLAGGTYAEYSEAATCEKKPPGTGAGGWAMSAKDLLRYFVSVDGLPAREILTPQHLADSTTPGMATKMTSTYARSWITGSWRWCGSGARKITHGHNGGLAGAFSSMFQLEDGYSFAIIGNQDLVQGACEDSVTRFLNILNTIDWPEHDLF